MSKKNRINVVYSTNPDYNFQQSGESEELTPDPNDQLLLIKFEKKGRAGKSVTLIDGFKGNVEDLKNLERKLKSFCGVGGSVKDGVIIIQGDQRTKIMDKLNSLGYKTKKTGG